MIATAITTLFLADLVLLRIEKMNEGLHMQYRLSAVCNMFLYARILDSPCTELVRDEVSTLLNILDEIRFF